MMASLSPVAPKLSKLLPRLASDHDGEVIATVRAIGRTLTGAGLDFHALAAAIAEPGPSSRWPTTRSRTRAKPKPTATEESVPWLAYAVFCQQARSRLKANEVEFVDTMVRVLSAGRMPSEKQGNWLRDIAARLREGAAS